MQVPVLVLTNYGILSKLNFLCLFPVKYLPPTYKISSQDPYDHHEEPRMESM